MGVGSEPSKVKCSAAPVVKDCRVTRTESTNVPPFGSIADSVGGILALM